MLNYYIFTKSTVPLSTKATERFLARVSALVVPSCRCVRELSMKKKQKNTVYYFVILNREKISCNAVLRIMDVYPGSRTNSFHPGTEFFHPESRIRIKEFKYFNPKNSF
jgi:hypothetical protein